LKGLRSIDYYSEEEINVSFHGIKQRAMFYKI